MSRRRPCFESRKRKNDLSARPEKRQDLQSGKGWRKKFRKSRKRRRYVGKKKNTRGIWLIIWSWIVSPLLNNNGVKIG